MPCCCKCKHYFAKSDLSGIGSFASESIPKNEMVSLFLKHDPSEVDPIFDRTDFCRLTNHSYEPNSRVVTSGKDVYVITNRKVDRDEEFTINYEDLFKQPWFGPGCEIRQKILRITPGFEDMHIEDDSHKSLFDEINYFRSMR
tara:strand:- start:1050 stop:1478 length:429 start_codon:yes stop_codon:yes gene_type:complete